MQIEDLKTRSGILVHHFLALSYFVYLLAIILGFGLDSFWPMPYSAGFFPALGAILIVLGTCVAFWAQYSTGGSNRKARLASDTLNSEHFQIGPYSYVRVPTQYSIFLMTLGLALLYGSLWMIIATLIAFYFGRFVFIPKEEHHLAEKYGQAFLDYKKKVRF